MNVPRVRVHAAITGLAIAAASFAWPAAATGHASAHACGEPRSGYSSLASPDFGDAEPAVITSYVVDRWRRTELVATNGSTIMTSRDRGCHWTRAFSTEVTTPGLGTSAAGEVSSVVAMPDGSIGAVVNPVELTVSADLQPSALEYLSPVFVVSADGGRTWQRHPFGDPLRVRHVSTIVAAAGGRDRDRLYALAQDARSQPVVLTSVDAGHGWAVTVEAGAAGIPRQVSTMAVGPRPRDVWLAGGSLSHSDDAGSTFTSVPGSPTSITAMTVATDGKVAVVSGGALWLGPKPWRRASTAEQGTVTGGTYDERGRLWVTSTRASGGSLYLLRPGAHVVDAAGPFASTVLDQPQPGSQPDVVAMRSVRGARSYRLGLFDLAGFHPKHHVTFDAPTKQISNQCYADPNPPPPSTWDPSWEPLPADEPWVYVTDFAFGGTFRLDRYGRRAQVGQTAGTPEGTTLDPFGRVIISGRKSSQLLRLDPLRCRLDVLDSNLPYNEGPTFDSAGNLYVVSTEAAQVWEYPWPQQVPAHRRLVYDFRDDPQPVTGLEDARTAPSGTRYAGDVFVLVFEPGVGSTADTGSPEEIARLHRGPDGTWHRSRFWTMPRRFNAVGFAFLPDGELLVPDIIGSGRIERVAADGKSSSLFAVARPAASGKPLSRQLAKVDVAPSGVVYVTAPDTSPEFCPAGPFSDLGGDPAVYRFDATGQQIEPTLTNVPLCTLGVSVIHLFPDLPRKVVDLARHRTMGTIPRHATPAAAAAAVPAAAGVYAGQPPVNPPPQPVSQPQPQAQQQPQSQQQSQSQSQSQVDRTLGFAAGFEPEPEPELALQHDTVSRVRSARPPGGGGGSADTSGMFMMSALVLTAAAGCVAVRRRQLATEPARVRVGR